MTVKEYLEQARKLNIRIDYLSREIQNLKLLSYSLNVSSPDQDRVMSSRSDDSGFARILSKIDDKEKQLHEEIDRLFALKDQIHRVLTQLKDPESEVILLYFYLEGLNCVQIGDLLHMHRTNVRRKRDLALERIVLPDDIIQI